MSKVLALALTRRIAIMAVSVVGVGALIAPPASAAGVSAELSSAIMNLGTGTTATSDARIIHHRDANLTVGAQVSTIVVTVKDNNGNAITADTLSASVDGPGLLGTGAGAPSGFIPAGRAISVSVSNALPGKYVFALFADGTGGFTRIEIHDGATLIATEIAAFYGPVALLTALPKLHIVNVDGSPLGSNSANNPGDGTSAHTPAVILTAKDANGIPVPDEDATEFSAVSSDLSVLSPDISVVPDDNLGVGSLGAGTYNVQIKSASGGVSGKSATLTFRYSTDRVNYVSSPPAKFTVSSTRIAKVTMTLDKQSYEPGESATLTIAAFDPSGTPVACEDVGGFFASSDGLTTSIQIDKMLFPFTTVTLMMGRITATFDLPTTSGLFTVTGRLGNAADLSSSLQGLPISATTTILTQEDTDLAATKASAAAALAAVLSLTSLVQALVLAIARIMKKFGLK